MRHISLAATSAALAALAACADTPTDPGHARPVPAPVLARDSVAADSRSATWAFADSAEAPIWVAYQEGDGEWKRVTPRTSGDSITYEFSVRGRGGVATVTRVAQDEGEPGYELAVYYGTAAELGAFGRAEPGAPAAGARKRLTGSVAGGGMMGQITVSLGSATTMVMPGQSSFTLGNVAAGPQDLVAALSSFSLDGDAPSLALSKVIIRRGLDLADGATIPTLDFGGDEAFAPASAKLAVEGASGAQIATVVAYRTAGGSSAMLSFGMGGDRYYGVPRARQAAGDLHMLTVMALPAGEGEEEESPFGGADLAGDGTRAVHTYFAEASDRKIALGPELATPDVSEIAGGGHARWRAKVDRQSEYAAGLVLQLAQDEARRNVTVTVTAGYAGDATSWEPTMPDLSKADGFDPSWAPRAGARATWALAAYGGDFAAAMARGSMPEDGAQYRFAVRASKGGSLR